MIDRLKKQDWFLTAVLIAFSIIGIVVIYSATSRGEFQGAHQRMIVYYLLGFAIMLVTGTLYNHLLNKLAYYIYAAGLFPLLFVLLYGKEINKAKGWLELPFGLSFQPAELAKIIVVITLAKYLGSKSTDLRIFKDLLPALLLVLIPFTLILIQPDLGNAMAFVFIIASMLWVSPIKYKHVAVLLTVTCALLFSGYQAYKTYHEPVVAYLSDHGKKHWAHRIDTLLFPEQVSDHVSYHLKNSLMAIGSGGLTGDGFLQGESVQQGRIPYVYSDSIVVVIGEEFGFLGLSALLFLYLLLLHRIITVALLANSSINKLMVIGIASILIFQVFQNVSMHLGLMPITGITLPFISYGGTSLITNLFAIGIVQSIRVTSVSHREDPE